MERYWWQYIQKKFTKFLEVLNSYPLEIIITSRYSKERIEFLDVQVIKKDIGLITDVFINFVDTHQ